MSTIYLNHPTPIKQSPPTPHKIQVDRNILKKFRDVFPKRNYLLIEDNFPREGNMSASISMYYE